MAQLLVLYGDTCLWNIVGEVLESEGDAVCKDCNDDEAIPYPLIGLRALTPRTIQSVVAF
jgi:hypothetical protein